MSSPWVYWKCRFLRWNRAKKSTYLKQRTRLESSKKKHGRKSGASPDIRAKIGSLRATSTPNAKKTRKAQRHRQSDVQYFGHNCGYECRMRTFLYLLESLFQGLQLFCFTLFEILTATACKTRNKEPVKLCSAPAWHCSAPAPITWELIFDGEQCPVRGWTVPRPVYLDWTDRISSNLRKTYLLGFPRPGWTVPRPGWTVPPSGMNSADPEKQLGNLISLGSTLMG